METLFGARNWNYLNRFGSVVILVFILCFVIQLSLSLLRSMVYLLLASRFFNKIKFIRVNGILVYGDTWATSLQSLARSFLHSLELHLPYELFASPTKSSDDHRPIFSAASAEADDSNPMTTSSTNTSIQLLPATSTTLNMAALNSCYFQMPRHLSCIEGEKQDWSTTTNLLPEDMLVEILARLPVKSLLRFRSVSKCWRDMVKEPSFITKHHLTQVALNSGNCVLTRARVPEKREMEFALLKEDEYQVAELPFSFELYVWGFDELYNATYQVAGPCNGIVVISDARDKLFLWNPATRVRLSLLRHCLLHGRTNCVVAVLMWDLV